jgi:hypothetical protein
MPFPKRPALLVQFAHAQAAHIGHKDRADLAVFKRDPCYHCSNVQTVGVIRALVCCACGVAVVWAADSIAQVLFNKVQAGVVENVTHFTRYTCVQTVTRSQFQLPPTGNSCAAAIATNERSGAERRLRWHDRLRLDVAVGEKNEMFSWAGATQFETGDITELVSRGASGSGEFGSFLSSVFGGGGEGFLYRGLQDTPLGRLAAFDFNVPLAKSHYEYSSGKKGYTKVGYHGTFFADPDSADLRELDLEATEFPATDTVCRVADKIEYERTQIGQNSSMLPKSSSMDVIYRNSTESLNETTFAGCREYVGESTISFDVDDKGNTPDSAKRADLRPLPAKTRLRVKIEPAIDSDKAAAGDPIIGVIETAVKVKGETLVHAGDKLHGRIVRLEQDLAPLPRWTVAILFETIERAGVEQKVALKPLDDGDRSPQGAGAGGRRGFTATAVNTITSQRPAGGAIYSFAEAGHLVLGAKFESDWESK